MKNIKQLFNYFFPKKVVVTEKEKETPVPIVAPEETKTHPLAYGKDNSRLTAETAGTSRLLRKGNDILVQYFKTPSKKSMELDEYLGLFGPFKKTPFPNQLPEFSMDYPAIDPLFEELLNKEKVTKQVNVRMFEPGEDGYDHSIVYFQSFKKSAALISLSAKQILASFIQSLSEGDLKNNFSRSSFFVLNVKYPAPAIELEDVRIVEISWIPETGKFIVGCNRYTKRSSFTPGVGKSTNFFVPFFKNRTKRIRTKRVQKVGVTA